MIDMGGLSSLWVVLDSRRFLLFQCYIHMPSREPSHPVCPTDIPGTELYERSALDTAGCKVGDSALCSFSQIHFSHRDFHGDCCTTVRDGSVSQPLQKLKAKQSSWLRSQPHCFRVAHMFYIKRRAVVGVGELKGDSKVPRFS